MHTTGDRWAAGPTYEDFMGRWSRRLAHRFVSWLGIASGVHWLDVGCGTGALTNAIASDADPASVVGCDPSQPFIEFARSRYRDGRVEFVHAGVGSLPPRTGGYGSVTSLLALNFFPAPASAVREMQSLTTARGAISACVWDYGGRMEFLRTFWDAAASVDPAARELDEGRRFPICQPDSLKELFEGAGLDEIRCEPLEIETVFTSFDDYWRPLLGGTGPVPAYVGSLEAERRDTLSRRLDDTLPRDSGGEIRLTARAWAVRGSVKP